MVGKEVEETDIILCEVSAAVPSKTHPNIILLSAHF
jgi:hypothetical protein